MIPRTHRTGGRYRPYNYEHVSTSEPDRSLWQQRCQEMEENVRVTNALKEKADKDRIAAENHLVDVIRAARTLEVQCRAYQAGLEHLQDEFKSKEMDLRTKAAFDAQQIARLEAQLGTIGERHSCELSQIRADYQGRIRDYKLRLKEQDRCHSREISKLRDEFDACLRSLRKDIAEARDGRSSREPKEWFTLHERKWQEMLVPKDTHFQGLAACQIPWPVFRSVERIEDLTVADVKRYFQKKYPDELGSAWRADLKRWHPDKIGRLATLIHPDAWIDVQVGFSVCIQAMLSIQADRSNRD
ncbi:hypothetical protein CPB83DRAFT_842516 [Crepidotus variabilis]|uniref:Uncharacterized protein n=1 Tax=Crepidotus variabilis TaxID=179855 RepID=A0A9P6EVW7_9AGAR|nr:hypothetical protein CPB83DRAFT_842516 [Crepidotus variabilis]